MSAPQLAIAGNHDPLDRYYTPDPLAVAIVGWLRRRVWPSPGPRTVIEPSVGGGAFVRAARDAWPSARILGYDLDPGARGLALCHLSRVASWIDPEDRTLDRADLVLGNPPFSGQTAIPHVARAISRGATVALILPWAPVSAQVRAWRALPRPYLMAPIDGRPWSVVREVGVFVWAELNYPPAMLQCDAPIMWRGGR